MHFFVKFLQTTTKYGFNIYIVHYFVVGPVFILMKYLYLPIPLQVPIMAIVIFSISWIFTWSVYRILGNNTRWIMG